MIIVSQIVWHNEVICCYPQFFFLLFVIRIDSVVSALLTYHMLDLFKFLCV